MELISLSGQPPERRLTPPETMPLCRCRCCLGDIWPGEVFGLGPEGRAVCIDCVTDEWRSLTAEERCRVMGYEPMWSPGRLRH